MPSLSKKVVAFFVILWIVQKKVVPLQIVMNEHKIINDPVFGFIKIRRGLLYDIVQHPLFQRLNRIVQLGLASVVYPGARHTRFQHSLGALHLMSEAVKSLTEKGIYIFDSEAEAVQAAILMHDIGHGPFSHVLENTLMHGISHEEISLLMMEQINNDLKGQLNLAISIFKDERASSKCLTWQTTDWWSRRRESTPWRTT